MPATKRTTATKPTKAPAAKFAKRTRTTHGGEFTPRAPKGRKPLQEFSAWCVADADGNAERGTVKPTRAAAILAFYGHHGDRAVILSVRAMWDRDRADGYHARPVAVVDNGPRRVRSAKR